MQPCGRDGRIYTRYVFFKKNSPGEAGSQVYLSEVLMKYVGNLVPGTSVPDAVLLSMLTSGRLC